MIRSSARTRLLATLPLPVAAGAVLGAQAHRASTAGRPDLRPTYEVRATVAAAPAAAGAPLDLVVVGDSTAAGVGSPTVDQALPVLVARRVADALGRDVRVVGHGVSGARTSDVLDEQLGLVADRPVDVLLVVVGSNDVTSLAPPWVLYRRTVALLHRAAQAAAGAPVVLGGIPRFRAPLLPQPLREAADLYARPLRAAQRAAAARAGARFVDIAALASPRFRGRPEAMSADGYHPSPVGYGFWADALAPAVVDAVTP